MLGIDDDDIIIALFEQRLDTIDGYNALRKSDIAHVCVISRSLVE